MKRKIIIFAVIGIVVLSLIAGTIITINYVKRQKINAERKKLVEEYFASKISLYESENPDMYGVEVAFLGDSLTDGCNLSTYYEGYSVTNRGIGGDTSEGLKTRMKVSAYDVNPKVIVLLIGGNDILGGKNIESLYRNYEDIISGIKENLPETKIVWCSLTAMGNKWAKHNDTAIICNQKIKLLSEKYDCTFVDLFTPLCNVETGEIFENYTVEGVHFTDDGYKIVSTEIKKALSEILNH